MALSVCFLTRNEEACIGRAIRSVAGLADQVLVVDTTSRDRTVAIARELGADVASYDWDDDFAAARNATIHQARGDWVLWMHANEELLPASHAALREAIARPDAFGYVVALENLLKPDQPPETCTESADVRLFRKHPELQFVGRLQPTFTPAFWECLKREGRAILPSEIRIRHHLYLSEMNEGKLRWRLRLLEAELRDRPGQLPYLIDLARTLLLLNDLRGHAVYAEAAAQVRAHRDDPKPPHGSVAVLLKYLIGGGPEASRAPLSADEARELALRWFPSSPPLLWALAGRAYEKGDFREAVRLLERLVHLGRTRSYDRSTGFDPAMVGDDALANLGACYGRLGELDRAEACYRALLANPKFHAEATHHLALIQRKRLERGGFSFSFDATTGR